MPSATPADTHTADARQRLDDELAAARERFEEAKRQGSLSRQHAVSKTIRTLAAQLDQLDNDKDMT